MIKSVGNTDSKKRELASFRCHFSQQPNFVSLVVTKTKNKN